MRYFYVYILTNLSKSVLYIGVTNSLERRLIEHRSKINPFCFTSKYNVSELAFFEVFESIEDAIKREKSIKRMSRVAKEKLIKKFSDLRS